MRNKKGNVGATVAEMVLAVSIIGIVAVLTLQVLTAVKREKSAMAEQKKLREAVEVYDPALTTTVRNNSYVRLGIPGSPSENAAAILKIVGEFELKNPDKEVVGWSVDAIHTASGGGKVYGLWINHRPKTLSLEK